MKIMVAVPAISYPAAEGIDCLNKFGDIYEFEPMGRNLDVFHDEMPVDIPGFFGINVPHWSFKEKGGLGLAGPGDTADEMFYPPSLEDDLGPLAGQYDKWRPYPAGGPISNYSKGMAGRYSRKRCRMFVHVAHKMKWDVLFYVEHAPSSLAHLDEGVAASLAKYVIQKAISVYLSMPFSEMVVFSPYGTKDGSGFVCSNILEPKELCKWSGIRKWIGGNYEDCRHRSRS
jgi:hypothetical protein